MTIEQVDPRLLDKSWRIEHLYFIKDKNGKKIQFKLNRAQRDFQSKVAQKNIILKSRQLGFTTLEAIDILDTVLFSRNFDALLLSYDQDSQLDIFDNKINFAWQNFPLQDLYKLDADRANKLKFDFGDGTFSSISVKTSGRSGTYHRLHISEFGKIVAKYPDKTEEILSGTIPSVPFNGRIDIESTAEGDTGAFAELFLESWEKKHGGNKNDYRAHFYNWTWDDEEIQKSGIIEVPDEFREYQNLHNLTNQQISYYYQKFLSLGSNKLRMHREYPLTVDEAFESAGGKFFDLESLKKQISKKFEYLGKWRYFENYKTGHNYAMGVDPSEGIGRNPACCIVWDFTPIKPKVVAEFNDNETPPDLLAYEILVGARAFGNCLVAVERNNHGFTTLSKLKEIYPNIYQEEKFDKMTNKKTTKLGWNTNLATKPKMLYDLRTVIDNEAVELSSADLIRECKIYPINEVDSMNNDLTHYDRVIAAAIGFQMRSTIQNFGEITTYTQETFDELTQAI